MANFTKALWISALAVASACGTASSRAEEITRYPLPTPGFPISLGVEVPAGKTLVYLSGAVPPTPAPDKDGKIAPLPSDTQAQAVLTLQRIEQSLKSLRLTLGDVVFLRAYLVGDPALGRKLDFGGFNAAYKQFFGTAEQPALPARSVVQVAGLARPDFLVEIEVIAARK
jgi:enamine deaminase RidA (YjgF/YER057c/UK114 family)